MDANTAKPSALMSSIEGFPTMSGNPFFVRISPDDAVWMNLRARYREVKVSLKRRVQPADAPYSI